MRADAYDYCTKMNSLCMYGCPWWTLCDGDITEIGYTIMDWWPGMHKGCCMNDFGWWKMDSWIIPERGYSLGGKW